MKKTRWHLDIPLADGLFSQQWQRSSNEALLKIFRHVDASDKPVLTMLPPGVSPAGALASATFNFLAGMKPPRDPLCRIAVYPGLHFARQIRQMTFKANQVLESARIARKSMRGTLKMAGPFLNLNERLKDESRQLEDVHFQSMFRSRQLWIRNFSFEYVELGPRDYLGRDDPFGFCVDFIATDKLDMFLHRLEYDLLIYCPWFHSNMATYGEIDVEQQAKKILRFPAERKLILVRSPYGYWARKLEPVLGVSGFNFGDAPNPTDSDESVRLIVADQFLDFSDSVHLFRETNKAWREPDFRRLLSELRSLLRRLLVSFDPRVPTEKGETIFDTVNRIGELCEIVGLDRSDKLSEVLSRLKSAVNRGDLPAKLGILKSLSEREAIEVWVTKDDDFDVVTEFKARERLSFTLRKADRWMAPGAREPGRKVVLTRIDRENDIDLVSYLEPNDIVLVSSWEAVIRSQTAMRAWEQSEKWIEEGKRIAPQIKPNRRQIFDPVLEVANALETVKSNHEAKNRLHVVEEMEEVWWDDQDYGRVLEPTVGRADILREHGDRTHACSEIILENGCAVFLPVDGEVQVIAEQDESDAGELLSVPVARLKPGMTILLFRDAERSSIFELLMDQLERTDEFSADARIVRDWKLKLRNFVHSKGLKVTEIVDRLSTRGVRMEYLTVRSWVFGPTMAPMKKDNLLALLGSIELDGVDADSIFASVRRLRSIAMTLGKALNQLILAKHPDELEGRTREMLLSSGIDIEELSGAVDTRRVIAIGSQTAVSVSSMRKVFRVD